METTVEAPQSRLRTLYYWTLLLITLIIVDDLTFGWIFWALAQVHPFVSASAALIIYWSVGYWITIRGLKPEPGKFASAMLSRLQLDRGNPELRIREEVLKQRIRTVGTAIPMSLLFGGVVVTLWLRRRGVIDDQRARVVAFWLCGLYALEFAVIHGFGIGGGIFIARQ